MSTGGTRELVSRLKAVFPDFVSDPETEALAYVWMGSYVRHVIGAHGAGQHEAVRAAFAVIEETVEIVPPGGMLSAAANLAVVGFIEDLQNENLHPDGSSPADFLAYLGPKSAHHWDSLNGFWQAVAHHKARTH